MTSVVRFDTAALNRALIGFDRIISEFENKSSASGTNYPPHNILKLGENHYEIQIAVAGFSKDELEVEVNRDQLVVRGIKSISVEAEPEYLYRGLAHRDFEKRFPLAEYMEVGEVELTNGLLCVKITRIIPDALKSRLIDIKG